MHEDMTQEQAIQAHAPLGAVALQDTHFESDEDPLASDVDRSVHPDETRTDDQIERDEAAANRLHMSGDDDSDVYWADYDQYFGTIDGGQTTSTEQVDADLPKTTIVESKRTPGFITITTPKGFSIGMGADSLDYYYPGMSLDEIGKALDDEEDDREAAAANEADEAAYPTEHDTAEYINGYRLDNDQEDPLAGDVDRWVHPDETKDL